MASSATVREIKRLDEDEIVRRFTGKIVQLWKYNSGKKKGREWSIQAGMIEDEDGDEIKFVLKDREELERSYNGKTVTILAHEGSKDWSGIYARDDEYEGETQRVLWITATAEIVKGGRAEEGRDRDNDRDRDRDEDRGRGRDRDRDRDDDRGSRGGEGKVGRGRREDRDEDRDRDRDRDRDKDEDRDHVKEAKYELMRLTNLLGLSAEAAWFACQEFGGRHKFTCDEETLSKVWLSLFIAMQRRGWDSKLPIEDIFESGESGAGKSKAKDKEDGNDDKDKDKDKDKDRGEERGSRRGKR